MNRSSPSTSSDGHRRWIFAPDPLVVGREGAAPRWGREARLWRPHPFPRIDGRAGNCRSQLGYNEEEIIEHKVDYAVTQQRKPCAASPLVMFASSTPCWPRCCAASGRQGSSRVGPARRRPRLDHLRGVRQGQALATRADTGEVLHARIRKGAANTQRGAVRFVEELVARVRRAGAGGELIMRFDSGHWSITTIASSNGLRSATR
jgi:hypothetical protein